MKQLFSLLLLSLFTVTVSAQDKPKIENTTIEEVVIKAEAARDFGDKIIDMGQYYYCKFNNRDERNAIIDGHIVLSPSRITEIKRQAKAEHNVSIEDIYIISGKETKEYGYYQICAGGTKYDYVRKGNNYVFYKKMK